jgi:membrane-bound lytic murein transglycosylase B
MRNSLPDIFASVANYFVGHGWEKGGPIASRAQPDARPHPLEAGKDYRPQSPVEQYTAWGYAPLEHLDPGRDASMVQLQGPGGPEYWFTFQNFYVITRYNRSPLYAMAVNQLAEAIGARVGIQGSGQ